MVFWRFFLPEGEVETPQARGEAGRPARVGSRRMGTLVAISHVGLCVSDLKRSLRFYRD